MQQFNNGSFTGGVARQEFSNGGLTLPTRWLKFGFQCAINAKNLKSFQVLRHD